MELRLTIPLGGIQQTQTPGFLLHPHTASTSHSSLSISLLSPTQAFPPISHPKPLRITSPQYPHPPRPLKNPFPDLVHLLSTRTYRRSRSPSPSHGPWTWGIVGGIDMGMVNVYVQRRKSAPERPRVRVHVISPFRTFLIAFFTPRTPQLTSNSFLSS